MWQMHLRAIIRASSPIFMQPHARSISGKALRHVRTTVVDEVVSTSFTEVAAHCTSHSEHTEEMLHIAHVGYECREYATCDAMGIRVGREDEVSVSVHAAGHDIEGSLVWGPTGVDSASGAVDGCGLTWDGSSSTQIPVGPSAHAEAHAGASLDLSSGMVLDVTQEGGNATVKVAEVAQVDGTIEAGASAALSCDEHSVDLNVNVEASEGLRFELDNEVQMDQERGFIRNVNTKRVTGDLRDVKVQKMEQAAEDQFETIVNSGLPSGVVGAAIYAARGDSQGVALSLAAGAMSIGAKLAAAGSLTYTTTTATTVPMWGLGFLGFTVPVVTTTTIVPGAIVLATIGIAVGRCVKKLCLVHLECKK